MANDVFIQLDADYINQLTWFGCMYCLSPKTVQMCLTLLQYAHYESRWKFVDYFPHDDEQRAIQWDLYSSWVDQAEKELMDCQDSAGSAEYVSYDENGNRICSTDGSTWYVCNSGDPRFTGANNVGQTGTDRECKAADNITGVAQQFKQDIYDVLSGSPALVDLIIVIISFVAGLLSVGIGTPLVIGLANAIIGLGAAAFDAAIDTTSFDVYRCIIYCALLRYPDRAVTFFTQDQYDFIMRQIDVQLTDAVQNIFFKTFTWTAGTVGLAAYSLIGSGEGSDCGDCVCSCTAVFEFDWAGGLDNTDDFTLLTGADVPTDNPFSGGETCEGGSYDINLISADGGYYLNNGGCGHAPMMGIIWDVPEAQLGCKLSSIQGKLGMGVATYGVFRVWVDRGGGFEYLAGSDGLTGGYPQVWDSSFSPADGVQRIAVITNNADTVAERATYVGYLKFTFE